MYELINNVPLQVKEYNGQRVVTFKDIDSVHQRPDGTARKRFNDNRKHFIEGIDFYKITPSEFRTAFLGTMDLRQQNDITLVTLSGYLMISKSLTDDLSWSIQRLLVTYFTAQTQTHSYNNLLQKYNELAFRIEKLENRKLRSSGKQNIAQNRQLNGETETIDVIADIMAGDFEMKDITVTEFVQQNCILAKYSLIAIAKVLNKLGYKQTMKRRKGCRAVIRTRNLPVRCNARNK